MPIWLQLAKGPVMRFTLALLVLGLLRLAIITVWDMIIAIRRAGNRQISYRQIFIETLTWLLPITRIHRARRIYSYASFGFHLGILVGGFFLSNHINIIKTHFYLSWSALYKPVLDVLTLVTVVGGLSLLAHRIYHPSSRAMSKPADYLLLIIILNIALSGFTAGQAWNPIPYNNLMLFHTLNGIILLLVIPFTKITHCVLFPLIRLGSEIGWRLVPQAGEKVVNTLYGPEGRKI